jgi:hypothetical protein
MAIFRVTAEWTGFSGAPGYSVLHFNAVEETTDAAQLAADAVGTFFRSIEDYLGAGVQVRIGGAVDIIDEASGELLTMLNVTPPAAASSGVSTGYSAVSGAVVHWITNSVRNGRRVRGKNFIVPLSGSSYDSTGTLTPTVLLQLQGAADALVGAAPGLVVWARPSATGATDGLSADVTTARVPDKAAVLRSRRD